MKKKTAKPKTAPAAAPITPGGVDLTIAIRPTPPPGLSQSDLQRWLREHRS